MSKRALEPEEQPLPSDAAGHRPSSPTDAAAPQSELLSREFEDEDALAQRERRLFQDVDDDDDDDEGEDLFGDHFERDYRQHAQLDQYDPEGLDDDPGRDLSELSLGQRRAIDAQMDRRDRARARLEGRAFMGGDDDEDDEQDAWAATRAAPRRRRRNAAGGALLGDDEGADGMDDDDAALDDLDPQFQYDDLKVKSISEWVQMEQPRRHIARRFRKFLLDYSPQGSTVRVYQERIQRMAEQNGRSIEVSFQHLHAYASVMALWLSEAPAEMLDIFQEVAHSVVREFFDRYDWISEEIAVRVCDVPAIETLRDLRHHHVNRLVRVSGVVTRRSAMLPQIKYMTLACVKCGMTMGPFTQMGAEEVKLNQCSACPSKGPFMVKNEQTGYRDYQKVTLQEAPGTVPPGRLPRSKEVVLLSDLVDSVRPGEAIEVTGIYKNVFDVGLNATHGFPLFVTLIEANHIGKREDAFAAKKLSEEDKRAITELAKDPRVGRRIIKSIGPSIFGHEDIKTAIALSLFGGVAKDIQGKQRLRGDINVLLMGDPGTAKSQFLKYVEKTANRAVFTTGQGASAVGLTASVQKSPITREWTLEGGALVLADKGVCLIDEFDKMNEQDRTSIHEAMEQQSISISKAGIVCTLQARCAVIAAANPKSGRYNPMQSFQENVELTEPILSRFDVLCVVKDHIDVETDRKLAEFVVNSHMRSHPDYDPTEDAAMTAAHQQDPDLIEQDLLRKYLMYAKETCQPRLTDLDKDKLAKVYSALRRESLSCGSIPMTVRHVESMIRMSEAHARMHLRDYVRQDDLDVAIQVMLESFLASNKVSVAKQLRRKFAKFMRVARDQEELLRHLLKTVAQEQYQYALARPNADAQPMRELEFDAEDFELRAREFNVNDMQPFYESRAFTQSEYRLVEKAVAGGRRVRMIVKGI